MPGIGRTGARVRFRLAVTVGVVTRFGLPADTRFKARGRWCISCPNNCWSGNTHGAPNSGGVNRGSTNDGDPRVNARSGALISADGRGR